MKFIVVQTGARRGYAIPAILERAGKLDVFYTDLCGNKGLGKLLSRLSYLPVIGKIGKKIGSRKLPDSILSKTRTCSAVSLANFFLEFFGKKDPKNHFERLIASGMRFGRYLCKFGTGDATHVYSMLDEAGPFLKFAHERGLTVVEEVYICLSTEKILQQEFVDFPDWEPNAPDYAELRKTVSYRSLLENIDYFVCPSEFVQNDLICNWSVDPKSTVVVPYGMDPRWLALESNTIPRRVLFAGTADLRKGIHYLAMAAEILSKSDTKYEFIVAGNVSDVVRSQSVCRHLTFLGRVPRDQMHKEFQKADVFVLPSLAEGSAEVTYEAMASGLPVVVTKATGSVARDEIEGVIVPERNPEAIANAILRISGDRVLRETMAIAARQRAKDYTWEKYGDRLITALNRIERKGKDV